MDTPARADVGGQVRRGIVWSTATFVGSKAITFVATVVLARLLAPSEFGVVAAVLVYVQMLELASDLGLGSAVVYEQEEGQSPRVDTAFTVNVLIGALLAGLGVLLAPLIASFFRVEGHTDLFRLASLSLLLSGFSGISDAMMLRELAFNRRIIPQVGRGAVRGGVAIVFAALGFGAISLVLGLLAAGVFNLIANWWITRFRPRFHIERAALRPMLAYGGASTLLEILALIGGRVDVAAIGRVLGERALGLYTIAFRVPELIIENVAWNVSAVAFPALARKRAVDEGGVGRATLKLIRYQTLCAAPVALGVAVLSAPLIVTLFGPSWRPAAGVMSAIAVMTAVTAAEFALGDLFKAMGRPLTLVWLNALLVPVVVASIVGVSSQGIVTVAWARAGAMVLHALLVITTACRTTDVTWRGFAHSIRPGLVAGAGVGIGAGLVRLLWPAATLGPLLLGTLAGGLGGALALRLFAPETLAELRELARRLPRPARLAPRAAA